MILTGVYNALREPFENKGLLTFSGYQDKTSIPYIYLAQSGTAYFYSDTCLTRVDDTIVNVSIYNNYFDKVTEYSDLVSDLILYEKLTIPSRQLVGIEELAQNLTEVEKGIYRSFFQYEIKTQKEISPFEFTTIEAADIYTALYQRYTNTTLERKTNGFVTTRFAEGSHPILYIPTYNLINSFVTTCSRIDSVDFSINFESYRFDELEDITEEIDNLFSYLKINLTGAKKVICMEWLGNNYQELEPGFWQSVTNFRLEVEKNIG